MPEESLDNRLAALDLHGFTSIRHLDHFELRDLNVLIGANGTGKSNLISFFRLLSRMVPSPGSLQLSVGKSGGGSALLHDGPDVTREITTKLVFETPDGGFDYRISLCHAAPDTFVFGDESLRFPHDPRAVPPRRDPRAVPPRRDPRAVPPRRDPRAVPPRRDPEASWVKLGSGHRETALIRAAAEGNSSARVVLGLLKRFLVYHFQNTSITARIRQRWSVDDGKCLKEDGGNLAAFLYRLRETRPRHYAAIVDSIRLIAPFFADFVLDPTDQTLLLQWREHGTDMVFGPHHASDGTLRVMALVALLLQPTSDLPSLLILDEPELGLHPHAINVIAGLIRSVSLSGQVILATQSTAFLDHFEPQDVVVVERQGRESVLRRLKPEALDDWLNDYSLSELWEKNVLGGRPGR